jgi:FkbH-like protein
MMEWSLANCAWLPEPPATFRDECAAALLSPGEVAGELYRLSRYRLNPSQLKRLAATLATAQKNGFSIAPLSRFRLGLVSNATTALITPALIASALRYGICLEVVEAGFGQVMQEALEPESAINRAELDGVLLALDHRGLPFADTLAGVETGKGTKLSSLPDDVVDHINLLLEKFGKHGGRAVIVQTVPGPSESLFGSYEYRLPSALRRQTESYNSYLAELAEDSGSVLLDVATLANRLGLDRWHDPMQWNLAKLPFSQSLVPVYADHVARLLGAIRGKSRKCLVLDLDNTLWGGVIGDDGLDGILLGQGNALGEAFSAIQRVALDLRNRGVVLAVCSKNDMENALLPFRSHPEMVLKEEHIAVFQANWNDKASNLEEIAKLLNIGLDALVLLDDNPAERAQVRATLPQVSVPELPGDPAFYPRALLAGGYFESVGYTNDDRQRADQYQANAHRTSLRSKTRNLDDFLQSLEMTAQVAGFDKFGRSRIVQLINKTNQFNLTTRRYTEAQIVEMEQDPALFTLQVRLQDRFGDNGMISVVICRSSGSQWQIDTWLMSCRVIKRRVEELVLDELVRAARQRGITGLQGCWLPSGRNDLVREHYANLGFTLGKEQDGATCWQLDIDGFSPRNPPIQVTG